jgi:hypothetical protein
VEETVRCAWLDESPLTEAACVTFVEGMDLAAVATAFGGSLDEAVEVAADGVGPACPGTTMTPARII